MTTMPATRPLNPRFSSGPCSKRPGWTPEALKDATLGRSHRSKAGKAKLQLSIDLMRDVLGVPADYRIGIVAGSDTGAVEMAMWSMLGARPVDVFAWESFGECWVTDVVAELKLKDARTFVAPYGHLPKLAEANFDHDVVFTWNGTAAGVRVPNADWIPADRKGLTICDATSAAFAQALDFSKLDVVTFSWQKVLGGEAAHGVIVIGPRAAERLKTYEPAWPIPKLYRLAKGGKLLEGVFEGDTINTPSMLCVEDSIDTLRWAKNLGGAKALIARADANSKAVDDWVAKTPWVGYLAVDPLTRSNTSVCLRVVDPAVATLPAAAQAAFARDLVGFLESEKVAYDIGAYRDAPPGLRIWCGGTVETSDVVALTHWLDYAFALEKAKLAKAA